MIGITFGSDVSLIVGPNNSGKSNIFRILKLLIDMLDLPAKGLDIQSVFSATAEPYLSVKLTLSEEEANVIIDFISLLVAHRKVEDSYPLMNRAILVSLVDEISIKLSWSGLCKPTCGIDLCIQYERRLLSPITLLLQM